MRVLDDGTVVTVPVPDNQTRQRAVEAVYDVVGAKQNTKHDGDGGGTKLTLVLPDYYSPAFIAREKSVIDVSPVMDSTTDDGSGPGDCEPMLDEDVPDFGEEQGEVQDVVGGDDAEAVDAHGHPVP